MKVIALMGKAGSGKDTILKAVIEQYPSFFQKIVSVTTRPMREGEQEGIDYNYITEDQFNELLDNDVLLEFNQFNGWLYGTSKKNFSETKINIGVFNPAGVRSLMEHDDIRLTVYYVICPDKMRLIRQLERESDPDVKEIIRRFGADGRNFATIDDINYISIPNTTRSHIKTNVKKILGNIH